MMFDWNQGFGIDFDLLSGTSQKVQTTKRYLSDMKKYYYDITRVNKKLQIEDPLIYEYYELGCPEREGDLAFGTTTLYPGKIGNEYYMTKGHFHQKVETAEVYYTLSGNGLMMLENEDGDIKELIMKKGEAVYVPRGYAHRTVNTGKEKLIFFYVYAADAGHDYKTIETLGFHHIACELKQELVIKENPRYEKG